MRRVAHLLFLTVILLVAYARVGFTDERVFMTCDAWNRAELNPATKGSYILWLQGYWEGLAWPQLSAAMSNNPFTPDEQFEKTLRPVFPTHMSMDAIFVEITSRCKTQPPYSLLIKIVNDIAQGR
jgi:hypothetical protein